MNIKKFLMILYAFLLFLNCSFASEVIHLQTESNNNYNIPESTKDRLYRISQEDKISSIEDEIDGEDFISDEEVFDSNVGQFFSKFIDNKIINNKYSNFPNKIKTLKY